MTKEANEREYRVLDQSLSMHSVLAQEFARKERRLNISLLLISAVLCAFTFAEDPVLSLFRISPAVAKLLIGVCSAFVFGLSIVELKVNWSGVSEAHADAARRLAALKIEYRKIYASLDADKTSQWTMLSQKYAEISGALPPIDERQFMRLKAHHTTKVALSKMVDQHPGVPVFVLAVTLRFSAYWRLVATRNNSSDGKQVIN